MNSTEEIKNATKEELLRRVRGATTWQEYGELVELYRECFRYSNIDGIAITILKAYLYGYNKGLRTYAENAGFIEE